MNLGSLKPDWSSPCGRVALFNRDCMDILPQLPEGCVDAVVTDPPYAVPTIVAQTRETTKNAGDLSIAETAYRVHANEWKRLLGEMGRAFVFCDGASYPSMYRAMYSRFNLALLVWDKGRIGMGREFRKSHELIVHGWGSQTAIVSDGVGRPDIIRCDPLSSDGRVHPAEKPSRLISSLLPVCGNLIVDPFMGSASTGVSCVESGRQFVGIEIEPTYFDIAVRRISEALGMETKGKDGMVQRRMFTPETA